jgi:hypothetical protein
MNPDLEKIRWLRDTAKILRDNETHSAKRLTFDPEKASHHRGRASAFDFVAADLTRYLNERGVQ